MKSFTFQRTSIVTGILLVLLCSPDAVQAKRIMRFALPNIGGKVTSPGDMQGSITLPYDSGTGRKLLKIEALLKKKKYAEAASFLGQMLEQTAAKDSFFKISAKQQSLSSLNSRLREMIGALPADGREEYENRFGNTARHLVEEAQKTGRVIFLEEAIVKYLHTEAGYDALYRLGSFYEDRGLPLEAAFCYSRLISFGKEAANKYQPNLSLRLAVCWDRAGKRDQAKSALVQLKQNQPETIFKIAGKTVKLFQKDRQALTWLTAHVGAPSLMHSGSSHDWSMTHSQGEKPLQPVQDLPFMTPRWSHLMTESGTTLRDLENRIEMKINQEIAPIMPYEPLVIGERLFMRTRDGFAVFSLSNGKLLWNYPSSNEPHETHYNDGDWSNYAHSSLSTNGDSIFMVEDIQLPFKSYDMASQGAVNLQAKWGRRRWGGFGGGLAMNPFGAVGNTSATDGTSGDFNTLSARDIRGTRQGNLNWIIGGESGGVEPRLAGAFFLGTPLYFGGRLFVIYEKNRGIHLAVIDPKKGRLLWSLELAQVQKPISIDSFRKRAGATPTISDGIVLCPTSGGGVVAVDLTMHSLLWAYRYNRTYESRPQTNRYNRRSTTTNKGHWANASLTVANGKVILSPMESSELHCLDLKTGKALWKQPRGNKLFVAGVHQDNLIIVWATGVSAIKISNGVPAWKKTIPFKKGVLPAGRGVLSSNHFYLPLTDATIAQVDISTGSITQKLASSRGTTLGNLIWYRGLFVSQGLKYLEVFEEAAAMTSRVNAALEKNPNDINALTQMAQIEQSRGETASAITQLRRAYKLRPVAETRSLLIAALLDGVRMKLPQSRDYSNQLDRFAVE